MNCIITLPTFFSGEADRIAAMLRDGVADLIHIRKPQATLEEVEALIKALPEETYGRLVLHDHHSLAVKYNLYGVHLNNRNPLPPTGWQGSVSRSCHSFREVSLWKPKCNYVTLSPIFDSISKQGYHAAFTMEEIEEARHNSIIDDKVLALGGVTFSKLNAVRAMGFGGGVILGDAWGTSPSDLPRREETPAVLTIAGSDSSAGAGIQQDLRTIIAHGVYAATVITAITSQNTMGVQDVMPVPADVVRSQLRSVLTDLNIVAVKIGMIPNLDVARVITEELRQWKVAPGHTIVFDPVMVSTSGTRLMAEECIDYVRRELIPLCTLVTPNIPESAILPPPYPTAFLIKGGHADGDDMTDTLHLPDGTTHTFTTKRIKATNLHGTGCMLSSAIAANMLLTNSLPEAIQRAKDFLTAAIANSQTLRIGHGNGPVIGGKLKIENY